MKNRLKVRAARSFILLLIFSAAIVCTSNVSASDLVKYATSDIRVLYLFDRPDKVDWPVIFYLNDNFGARIDLVSLHHRSGFRYAPHETGDKEIYWHEFLIDEKNPSLAEDALARVLNSRRPDVVIFGEGKSSNVLYNKAEKIISELPFDSEAMFDIRRIFRRVDISGNSNDDSTMASVTLSREELKEKYASRIRLEVPKLSERFVVKDEQVDRIAQYSLIKKNSNEVALTPDFLSGFDLLRLEEATEKLAGGGATGKVIARHARNFESFLSLGARLDGQGSTEKIINGYKELLELDYEMRSMVAGAAGETGQISAVFTAYIKRLLARNQRAVLDEIGLDWQGKIILRDSPHGPKLKFRASLAANGSNVIELSYVRFLPYWQEEAVVLDSVSRLIQPHQMFVREYGVEVDRARLENELPESLSFRAEIVFGRIPLTVNSSIPIWEKPDIDIKFEPGFTFVSPVARLDVDRVAAALNWKVVINKPLYYYGKVNIQLETPRGVFAGSYRQQIRLDKGRTTETVRIPFSVSNLFEPGVQNQIVSLLIDDRVVAADTGIIRVAESRVADTVTVGFIPDTLGQIEDILRMIDASHRPLTDRSLLTGDLDAYNVILIGSGGIRNFPSFRDIRGRLEDFVRFGGSLVIFGQPEDWPNEALPVSFVPSFERLSGDELLNRIPKARILSKPFKISEVILLSGLDKQQIISGAVISPAEKVYVTPSGATLLSVSRIGSGQLVFCGLPLTEMISKLNIEAIHLLSNILNY